MQPDPGRRSQVLVTLTCSPPPGPVSVLTDSSCSSGANANLRDYSGHIAFHYLKTQEPEGPEEDSELCECLMLTHFWVFGDNIFVEMSFI